MRNLFFVRSERADLSKFDPEVERIRNAFDRYLDSYPVKTARTKTGLMGPVGKILSEARSKKWDAESLTGYALNIHLMNPRVRGFIAPEARVALRDGIQDLVDLLGSVPPTAEDKLLDRIDYGLYWIRRKKGMEFMDQIREEFAGFLRGRYPDVETLSRTWSRRAKNRIVDFESISFPSPRGRRFAEASEPEKADIVLFWKERGEEPEEAEEGEE